MLASSWWIQVLSRLIGLQAGDISIITYRFSKKENDCWWTYSRCKSWEGMTPESPEYLIHLNTACSIEMHWGYSTGFDHVAIWIDTEIEHEGAWNGRTDYGLNSLNKKRKAETECLLLMTGICLVFISGSRQRAVCLLIIVNVAWGM